MCIDYMCISHDLRKCTLWHMPSDSDQPAYPLFIYRTTRSLVIQWASSQDSDWAAHMYRLVLVFTGHTFQKVYFQMVWLIYKPLNTQDESRPRWLSWMRRPTGDQEVTGSTPAEVGNILSWRLIMKYFLRSFSPFRWFKKGSCQFLAKECAQYWLTA